jgi:hypothetical protein
VEEIAPFTQDDLIPDDVFLLDAGNNIFVWIGKHSTSKEQKMGMELSSEYSKAIMERYHSQVNSYVVYQVSNTM